MARSKSSRLWLQHHFEDSYVKKAHYYGYRSRSAYKLLELNKRDHLFRPGLSVIDLGAAPGGWCQVAANLVGKKGKVFALDILPMDPLPNVTIIQGNFEKQESIKKLMQTLNNQKVDLVISDIAPNISGIKIVDQPRAMYLSELVLTFSLQNLKRKRGALVMKVFQGDGFDNFYRNLCENFNHVVTRKPLASYRKSREVYIVAKKLTKIDT